MAARVVATDSLTEPRSPRPLSAVPGQPGQPPGTCRLFPATDMGRTHCWARAATVWGVTDSLVRRERHALCDTALAVGPDAPTLCGQWTARDLVAHLLVRENSMIGAAGITFSPLAGAHRAGDGEGRPGAVPRDGRGSCTTRGSRRTGCRGSSGSRTRWSTSSTTRTCAAPSPAGRPRELPARRRGRALEAAPGLRQARRPQGRRADRRTPPDRPGQEATVRSGEDPVVVTGRPSELVLFFFGRDQAARRDLRRAARGGEEAARVRAGVLGRVPQLLVDAGVVQARAGKGPGAHADWASSKRRQRRERVIWAASGAAMN